MNSIEDEKNLKENNANKLIIKVIKSLVLEIVKYRKEDILECKSNIENENVNYWIEYFLKNKKEKNKGFCLDGEVFYSSKNKSINKDNKNIRHNYSPEERIEHNFKNIKKKWIKI